MTEYEILDIAQRFATFTEGGEPVMSLAGFVGFARAIEQAATTHDALRTSASELTDEQLADILRNHWCYEGEPSIDDLYAAMREAIATSAPKGDGND